MSVFCKICNREFKKQITNSHLKTHFVSTLEYKEKYGNDSLSSPEYKKELSNKVSGKNNPNFGNKHTEKAKQAMSLSRKGKPAHNKGKKLAKHKKEKLLEGIERREKKYKSGELIRPNIGKKLSKKEKEKISNSVKNYAINNKDEIKQRTQKAIETKRNNGYDFAFFKGKKHTEESKLKILNSTKKHREKSKQCTFNKIHGFAISEGYVFVENKDNYYITVRCPKCSTVFSTTTQYFLPSKYKNRKECPHCNPYSSVGEQEILAFLKELLPNEDIRSRDKSIIWPNELDIYFPNKNIAIEYCGLYWHRDDGVRPNTYHRDKYLKCKNNNIKLITIFEDEWINNPSIVKNILRNKLGISGTKLYARKTTVKEIDSKTANNFIRKFHIHGSGRSNKRYGLYYNEELISVMTFSNSNISRKTNKWEINRFCSKDDYTVVGGASKLFKKFLTDVDPEEVMSFSDLRWGDGETYLKLNFTQDKTSPVNYWYWKNDGLMKRYHRYALRKTKNDPKNKTEWEIRKEEGWNRIWDCGHAKYIWKKAGE